MKRILALLLALSLLTAGCTAKKETEAEVPSEHSAADTETGAATEEPAAEEPAAEADGEPAATEPARIAKAPKADTVIVLSDDGITANGKPVSENSKQAVYTARDIVYYPTGADFTFGEGTEDDAHEAEEADGHTVLHITKRGTYEISGKLSAGQIFVDLGIYADIDPNAVVTLLLNGVDLTCTVAPAVIFYNVYECGNKDEAKAEVDTAAAGANVFLADGSVNNISGSYVARIYKPESLVLNDEGTEVTDAKKLHKYDAAFYSKMSMNLDGNDGILNILAENEGLDSERHLTVNGGDIRIESGNDGINTNEDGVSVTTVNGGKLTITVNGSTGEGDGIDSNGWLVINGGTVCASACGFSGDAGIDSDMGIYLNGGSVIASGNMLDHIAGGDLCYAVFNFASRQSGGSTFLLKNAAGEAVIEATPQNDCSVLILASEVMTEGEYTLWRDGQQLAGGGGMGGMTRPEGMQMPEGIERPEGMEFPEGMERPEGMEPPEGMERPEGMEFPEGMERPEGMEPPESMERPEGMEFPEGTEPPEGMERTEGMEFPEGTEPPAGGFGGRGGFGRGEQTGEQSSVFRIEAGGSYYSGVAPIE